MKFRYPFYTEILWYVVQRFVHCLLGKNYLICNESGEYLDHANEPASDALNLSSSPDKDPKLLSVTHNPMHLNGDKFSFPFKGIGDSLQQETSNGIKPEASNPDTSSDAKPVIPSDGNSMSCPESNMQKNGPKEHIHITTLEYNGLKVRCGYSKELFEFFITIIISKCFFLFFSLQAILKWLQNLPPAKKGIPSYIRDPDGLLEDLKVSFKFFFLY